MAEVQVSPRAIWPPRNEAGHTEANALLCQSIPLADRWGPFADGIDKAERRARLRSMRAIVHLCTGARGDTLARHLRLAEGDPAYLPDALAAMGQLAALDRRHVLASFARLYRLT